MTIKAFQKTVWDHYKKQRRDLPWRNTRDPYKILVSEIMLQQTQVDRVAKKYGTFLKVFPTFEDLAKANTKELLTAWQGLGYNRRALNLKRTAEIISKELNGDFPKYEGVKLPGLGAYTWGAVRAFAFNIPSAFIETNIRTVFIHHFFKDKKAVHDRELLPYIEKALDHENPRDWYYALMDYGAHLKKLHPNPSRKSAHHSKQSKFKGSNRELRSRILKYVLHSPRTIEDIKKHAGESKHDLQKNLDDLVHEGFLVKREALFSAE